MPRASDPGRKKPVLIGQAPSLVTSTRPRVLVPLTGAMSQPAFSGLSGAFLAGIAGLTRDQLLSRVEAVNLLDDFPGRSGGKGDRVDLKKMRERADSLLPKLRGRDVVLAGRVVAEAFGISLGWMGSESRDGATFLLIPHPSGVNSLYNKPGIRRDVRELIRRLVGLG